MRANRLNQIQSLKILAIRIVFCVLGKGFASCSKYDNRVRIEVDDWSEGTTILLSVADSGPRLMMKKQGGKIRIIKNINLEKPVVSIYFKSINAAILVITGRIGIWQAYAQHRFTLKGDIFSAMSVVRCMDSVENYLFPPFLTNNIIRKRPNKNVSSLKIYGAILFGLY